MSLNEMLAAFIPPETDRKVKREVRRECAKLERERRRTLAEINRLRRSLLHLR